jgi:hypothetical protein
MVRHWVGLDLGQARDFAALAILRSTHSSPILDLPFLSRFPLKTPYPAIVAQVAALLRRPELRGSVLAVDATGVGRAVVDLFRDALRGIDCEFLPITITSGSHVRASDGGGYHIPKRELVRVFRGLLASQHLRISRRLDFADLLVKELENFCVEITEAANEVFGAAGTGHDDLVLAVALGAWSGLR